ncbi:MAG: sugar phosphate isomerase/epimerase [Verrucomicrobiales bacterium]|jgi:sugar phosphate isomerase/epimerase|nr:sugar phosphate isomerase/epimerase [Verrucomicrobiales bacterium]
MNRRRACQLFGLTTASALHANEKETFQLRYLLSSAMYGEMSLAEILPEIAKTGSHGLDLWCRPHGNQREQIDDMGHEKALSLFQKHHAKPTIFTRYGLGPFGLAPEMPIAKKFGAKILLCGSQGPSEPTGQEAKAAIKGFLEKMKPHVAAAEEHGLTIAIENHSKQPLYHPDALRYFAEFNQSLHLGIALAFHHLYKFTPEIPALIRDLGDSQIPFIYFQEHSEGISKKAPKEIEMQQMPGFGGGLDYKPIVKALKEINYTGYCEIFMHPVPRGVPILPSSPEITAAINKSRAYIEACLSEA